MGPKQGPTRLAASAARILNLSVSGKIVATLDEFDRQIFSTGTIAQGFQHKLGPGQCRASWSSFALVGVTVRDQPARVAGQKRHMRLLFEAARDTAVV